MYSSYASALLDPHHSQAEMQVTKRTGLKEHVQFDKIQSRLLMLAYNLPHVDVSKISIDVIAKLYDGVTGRGTLQHRLGSVSAWV